MHSEQAKIRGHQGPCARSSCCRQLSEIGALLSGFISSPGVLCGSKRSDGLPQRRGPELTLNSSLRYENLKLGELALSMTFHSVSRYLGTDRHSLVISVPC